MKKLFLFLVVVVFLFIIGCQTETRSVDPWFESEEDASGWEIIINTAKRWFAGEDMMRDIQYWMSPWTVGDKTETIDPEEKETFDGTILGPATYIDEDGIIYLCNSLDE